MLTELSVNLIVAVDSTSSQSHDFYKSVFYLLFHLDDRLKQLIEGTLHVKALDDDTLSQLRKTTLPPLLSDYVDLEMKLRKALAPMQAASKESFKRGCRTTQETLAFVSCKDAQELFAVAGEIRQIRAPLVNDGESKLDMEATVSWLEELVRVWLVKYVPTTLLDMSKYKDEK